MPRAVKWRHVRSQECGEEPGDEAPFHNIQTVSDVEIDPIRIAAWNDSDKKNTR